MGKTAKCQQCGTRVVLPFKCSYCHGSFCAEHRLPENHACPEYWKAKAPHEQISPITLGEKSKEPAYKYTITYLPKPKAKVFLFSNTELKHLTLGMLLVMGVGLSVVLFYSYSLEILVILAIVFTLSFLLHELAHKISAQRLGLWAEFRLTMFGALITVLSMLIPFFKIISPGAMMIAGPVTRENEGKTALSGPLTNIVLSAVFSMIAVATPNPMRTIAGFGAWINAFIAIFNLIPFGIMDGLKVFGWNKAAWAIAFTVSLVLTVLTLSTHWF